MYLCLVLARKLRLAVQTLLGNVMSDIENEAKTTGENAGVNESVTWGPKLFYGVLIAVLVFFWWMVIYPHGVAPTH